MSGEIWKEIPDFPGYQASDQGRIRSNRRGSWKILKLTENSYGYFVVGPVHKRKRYLAPVHRFVLLAFRGAPPEGKNQGAHLNGDKADNRLSNLIWASEKENLSHRIEHGTAPIGMKNPNAKLNPSKVKKLREMRDSGKTWREVGKNFGLTISGSFSAYHCHWKDVK